MREGAKRPLPRSIKQIFKLESLKIWTGGWAKGLFGTLKRSAAQWLLTAKRFPPAS